MIDYDPSWALTKAREAHEPLTEALSTLSWPSHNQLPTPHAGHPYGRKLLVATEEAELVLIRWRPGQPCAIHNHGGGYGFVYLLQGEVDEQAWENAEQALVSKPTRHKLWSAGAAIPIDRNCVHSMNARIQGPTISLHLYIGVTEAMAVYDRDRGKRYLVSSDHGAWLPKTCDILEESPWTTK